MQLPRWMCRIVDDFPCPGCEERLTPRSVVGVATRLIGVGNGAGSGPITWVIVQCRSCGATGFVLQPVAEEVVCEAVRAIFEVGRASPPLGPVGGDVYEPWAEGEVEPFQMGDN